MKDIRIFVASSKELERERNFLAFLVLAKEEKFAARGVRVRLAKWEYVDPRMTGGRTEDLYLDEMYDCDAALVLFRDIAGMYTREELDKALAMEREGAARLKAHAILFAADGKPGSDAARLRESLPPDGYGTWSGRDELRAAFLELVERVAGMDLLEAPSDKYVRRITAFLAADEELADERNAFADTVLNVNDLLEQAHRNIRVQLRFYDPGNAESVLESSEMGLALYGTNYRVFGRKEIEDIHSRVKDVNRNPKRFYVFFRELDEATEKSLDETFKAFRSDFVTKFGHFICEFGDANALRLGFLLSLERYAGELTKEYYSTVSTSTAAVFVGREKELRKLHDLLEPIPGKFPAGRLPIITGAGGTGKSELVRQYASQLRVQYPGGVFQIDMERVRSWNEAFLGLLDGISNNGVRVKEYLNLERDKSDGPESGKPEPITGAKVRDALLKKARESGRILLVLDNVESCQPLLGRDGGFSKAFPAGFSERVLVNVVATARVCDVMLRPEDWAVPFPLGDLSPADALDLLLGDRTDVDAAERTAAKRVAELLGYRALYLRRVPALIGDLYAGTICDSYTELAKALEENLLGTVAEEIEGTHLPDVLWSMTRERLLKMPLGPECVKLAQVASFFSPDGFPQHILKHLWKTVVAPGQNERKFTRAVEILKHHNIFQSTDPIRIHRLDRAAILQTTKAEAGLEVAIGKSLAGYVGMSPDDWISLCNQPQIVRSVPEVILRGKYFVDGNPFNGTASLQALFLRENPAAEVEFSLEQLDGDDWMWVLQKQPEFATRCQWDKLTGENWANLLCWNLSFAEHCFWEKLNADEWATVVSKRPQFEQYCPWNELAGWNLAYILGRQPQLELRRQWAWEKLDGSDWVHLLEKQPQFVNRCRWKMLEDWNWAELLEKQPQLAERCPLEKLGEDGWVGLLKQRPVFADRCPWDKIEGWGWADLLRYQPQFAKYCTWGKLSGAHWAHLLKGQLQFAKQCDWKKLDGPEWANLLGDQPQFENECDWAKLSGRDWTLLLLSQPIFADRCPWELLDGTDWSLLLGKHPDLATYCSWEKLNGVDWVDLLSGESRYREYICSRTSNSDDNNLRLYRKMAGCEKDIPPRPQLSVYCPWEKLTGKDWVDLLVWQPQFYEHCHWEKLNGEEWAFLLSRLPQFEFFCSWEKLTGEDWVGLLVAQPFFARRCPWKSLEEDDLVELLEDCPRFIDDVPSSLLSGWIWAIVLEVHPDRYRVCPWKKLDGSAWSYLLAGQPQFADRCEWEKLNDADWDSLLKEQPQFAQFRQLDNERKLQ